MDRTALRSTYAHIHLNRIANNIVALQNYYGQETKTIAVVKANGYGHGAVAVASVAIAQGATLLAVAIIDEAIELREAGITTDILVLGNTRPMDISRAMEHNLIVTVFREEWMREVAAIVPQDAQLRMHIKIDSGLSRLGVKEEDELCQMLQIMKKHDAFVLHGVYTHFATADEEETTYYQKQVHCFENMLEIIETKYKSSEPILIHSSNSASAMRFSESFHHAVRLGISMYGYYPSPYLKETSSIRLEESMELKSELVHCKKIAPGDGVSYGATYVAEKPTWIGVVPIGYADGWLRQLKDADVLIDGKRFKILGRVCMDQLMVQLDKEYPVGTEVTLIGKDGEQFISMDEVARVLDTINYEVCCGISARVPRVYTQDGVTVTGYMYPSYTKK
ncbi:MAG: alanine racemase [Bacilli bacterium]